jgi:hypothetical protein
MTGKRSDEKRKEWHLPKYRAERQKGQESATPISLYASRKEALNRK